MKFEMRLLCVITGGLKNDGITNNVLLYYKNMDKSNLQIDILRTNDIDRIVEKKIREAGVGQEFSAYRKNIFKYFCSTMNLMKAKKYDIVHVHGSSALMSIELLAAFFAGCKVRIAHSRNTACNHVFLDKIFRPLFYCLCTERFACGEEAGKWLFGKREFTVIKNGKDLVQYKYDSKVRSKIRETMGWNDKIIIGHVGNFNYQKNHEFLIKLFRELNENEYSKYQLVLIGKESEKGYLDNARKLVDVLEISDCVSFLGSIDNVHEVIQGMDIMLLPSRHEGLPNVVLEWQIAGLRCVISNKITQECALTDLVEFLPIDEGTQVWVKTVEGISNSYDREVGSVDACERMKKYGFDIHENAKKLKEIYFKLLRKN